MQRKSGQSDDPSLEPSGVDSAGAAHDHLAAAWIAAARSGSSEAFGQLFARCRGYLLTVAREEIGPDLREKTRPSDLVQQTMMTAQQCFARFEGTSERELLAWLRGILLRQIGDLSKFYHREKRHVARELSLERDLNLADRSGLVHDERMTPGHALVRDEEARVLVAAMARLPAEYREVIVLRNWNRLPFAEVGQQMQRSPDAARKLWSRAVDALRQELERADEQRHPR